ncbi:3-oxoacyl-ACP reductase [Pelagibaculum spongiae]|uniref:3-oxoacyl-ACP reductase n=1 Tax=Pelagibaculum spongiae TaxID=2080658 RepID=A0A2V1H0G4_9GAMM|nr:3-oxoacyl-ACP reductase [Pelagibaculum spongiae]PVZ69492.1 3-oxoacyl-ACP reductase [Pelagibaculum spongiae]
MSDFIQKMSNSNLGRSVLANLGLPTPIELRRFNPAQKTFFKGDLLLGTAKGSELLDQVCANLKDSEARVYFAANTLLSGVVSDAITGANIEARQIHAEKGHVKEKFRALVFDATGVKTTEGLKELYDFFHPVLRNLAPSARVIIIGRPPQQAATPEAAAAQRGIEGLSRSIAKEIGKKGATCQVVYVENGADQELNSSLQFLLSAKSAYVSGQVITVKKSDQVAMPTNWARPLEGKVVLVTGGSRGIGESIARVMARDGAKVVVLDIPPAAQQLEKVAGEIGGLPLVADISAKDAPRKIADFLKNECGGVDVVVHNAGITRDKTLANMPAQWWAMTIDINLSSEERINEVLLGEQVMNDNGRIVCVSSMNGIAGQVGQTNYSTSKAGVIGYVQYMAPRLERGITINAVAPGFIETAMTDAIPFMTREFGRRLNSLSQGGKPVDVAETIAFFSSPASSGVTGNIVRVCGQCIVGA